MSFLRRAREYAGSLIIRAGVRVGGWKPFEGTFDFEEEGSEAPDPLHEEESVAMGVSITAEAASMISKPTPKPQVSPRPPLRGSLAARAHEERRNR
jgi:hypothetical protein